MTTDTLTALRLDHEELRRDYESSRGETRARMAQLDEDIAEIRRLFDRVATKDDMAALTQHVDKSINGILRDALAAVPGRQSLLWGTLVGLATVGTLVVKFLEVH